MRSVISLPTSTPRTRLVVVDRLRIWRDRHHLDLLRLAPIAVDEDRRAVDPAFRHFNTPNPQRFPLGGGTRHMWHLNRNVVKPVTDDALELPHQRGVSAQCGYEGRSSQRQGHQGESQPRSAPEGVANGQDQGSGQSLETRQQPLDASNARRAHQPILVDGVVDRDPRPAHDREERSAQRHGQPRHDLEQQDIEG
jgi:hypothetical protein